MLPIKQGFSASNSRDITLPTPPPYAPMDVNIDDSSTLNLLNRKSFKQRLMVTNQKVSNENNSISDKALQRYQELEFSPYKSATMSDFIKDPSTLLIGQRKYKTHSNYKKDKDSTIISSILSNMLAVPLFSIDQKDNNSISSTFCQPLALITALDIVVSGIVGKNIIRQYHINKIKIAQDYMENMVDKASKAMYTHIVDSHKILADTLKVDVLADLIMEFTLLDPFYELQWINWLEEWSGKLVSYLGKEQTAKKFKQWHANWTDKFKKLPTAKPWNNEAVLSKIEKTTTTNDEMKEDITTDITTEDVIIQINVIYLRVILSKNNRQFVGSNDVISFDNIANLNKTDDEDSNSYVEPRSMRDVPMPLFSRVNDS